MENLEHVSSATICQIGLLCMNTNDVGWSLVVDRWISKKAESEAELLRSLCNRYIGPTLDFLSAKSSVPPQPGAPPTKTRSQALEHAVFASELNMVETLIALVEVSILSISPRKTQFISLFDNLCANLYNLYYEILVILDYVYRQLKVVTVFSLL